MRRCPIAACHVALVALAAVATGCTTLKVTRLADGDTAYPDGAILAPPLVLPLKNELNQNTVLAVDMTGDGVLTKITMTSTPTWAANLKEVAGVLDTAQAVAAAQKKARDDARMAAKSATTDANKALSDCLAAQKAVKDAGGTPIGTCQ